MELTQMEQKAVVAKKAQDFAKRKIGVPEGKIEDSDSKLAVAISVVSTRDKELADLKKTMKQVEQLFYDMSVNDAENSSGPVTFETQRMGSMQGWMVAMDAINLPETSHFRDLAQVPLPKDPHVQALIGNRPATRGEEEERDSPSMRELAKKINSHIMVVYLDNIASLVAPEGTGTSEITLAPTTLIFGGVSPVLPDATQDPAP